MTIENPYKFTNLGLGVYLIETQAFEDHRGYFMEGYNKEEFAKNGINANFNQYNVSLSKKGVMRGLHYQKEPYGQAKMFRCVQGEIFDACVDVRRGSKTFGQSVSATYSARDKKMMFVPKGFANSIFAISDEDAIVVYIVEGSHVSEAETGLRWNDPALKIKWPMEPTLLSKKDQGWPLLKDIE